MIITEPDVAMLRARMTAALTGRLPGHARRLSWMPRSWPPSSATGCVSCWPAPSRARPSTPTAWPGSTLAASSWPICRGCR